MLTLIYFVLILGVIVLVHEFGHFIFAKMFGVYVYEFSIGMGPKIWSRKSKKDETVYCLRAIPIGGFVQLAGEEVDDDSKVPKEKKLYSKPVWQRFLIMFFGAGNNFMLAFLVLFFVALVWGAPKMDPIVTGLTSGYPMEQAGITPGDRFIKINGDKVSTIDDVNLYFAMLEPGENVLLEMKKADGSVVSYEISPKEEEVDGNKVYRYGIGIQQEKVTGITGAIAYTYKKTISIFKQMFITVGYLFTGGIKLNQLAGPVGIYSIVGESSKAGIANILYLMAFLSINVGFINLLPIPTFDGGHILFIIIEKLKGSPIKPELENKIHAVFLILLMLLMVVITINDIMRLF